MNIVAYIRSLFQRGTDKIVRPLTKIVSSLDHHARRQQDQANMKTVKAAKLLAKSQTHRDEGARAAATRAKIVDLIGV